MEKILFSCTISLLIFCFFVCPEFSWGLDSDNLQDTCPTDTTKQTFFINGFPCKNPSKITVSDFQTSRLNKTGDTDNFYQSSTTIVTAAEFPGLNTLGLSAARTDLEIDGLVMPHSHPRASEIIFVNSGIVVAGFLDSKNNLFQKVLRKGDVFIFPKGLLHYCLNSGFESATIFSVLNSQNPGFVSISGAVFATNDTELKSRLRKRLLSFSRLDVERLDNVTLFQF